MGESGGGARLGPAVGHGARRERRSVLQVVRRREAERVAQLPRPPRRGGAGRPRGVPLARRGRRGARRDLRRPPARHPAPGERAQGPRHRARRRGRDLPPDDPRGRRGDARVRAGGGSAQRGVRRLLAGFGEGPDAVLRGEGADHRRRRAAQGQDRADQAGSRRVPRRGAVDRDGRRGQERRRGRGDGGGPRRLVPRGDRSRRRRVSGRAVRFREPAVRALHLRLDGQAEGDPPHHGGLPDRRRVDAQARLRPQAGRGRVLVLSRRRLGHRPLVHRLRTAAERGDLRDVGGRARLSGQGHLVGAVRALRRDALLHRADRDPGVHEVGRRSTPRSTTCRSCACSGRSASRSTRRHGSGTAR